MALPIKWHDWGSANVQFTRTWNKRNVSNHKLREQTETKAQTRKMADDKHSNQAYQFWLRYQETGHNLSTTFLGKHKNSEFGEKFVSCENEWTLCGNCLNFVDQRNCWIKLKLIDCKEEEELQNVSQRKNRYWKKNSTKQILTNKIQILPTKQSFLQSVVIVGQSLENGSKKPKGQRSWYSSTHEAAGPEGRHPR